MNFCMSSTGKKETPAGVMSALFENDNDSGYFFVLRGQDHEIMRASFKID